MTKFVPALIVAAAFAAPSAFAQASSPANVKFNDLYAKLKAAMAERNTSAISAMLTPDFISEDVSGKTETGEQMMTELSKVPADPARKSETTVISADIKGDTANIVQRYHSSLAKPGSDGQAKVTDIDTESQDTWKLIGGVWHLSRTVTETLEYRVNGKLLAKKAHSPG